MFITVVTGDPRFDTESSLSTEGILIINLNVRGGILALKCAASVAPPLAVN
jgi:hypothetical protein